MLSKELNNLDDISLIKKIKNDDQTDDCLEILVERHSGIYTDQVNKYITNSSPIDSCDFFGEKEKLFHDFALDFDENKGMKFSSFVGMRTRFYCLNKLTEKKRDRFIDFGEDDDIEYIIDSNYNEEFLPDFERQEIIDLIKEIIENIKDKKISWVGINKYFSGAPVSNVELAAQLGVTSQTIANYDKKLREILVKELKKKKIFV